MKILIVEDDFVNRVVLEKYLSPYGQCSIAINGNEAVKSFDMALSDGDPFQLICLDIMMPEMNGQEALKEIRKIESEQGISFKNRVVIFMMTALDAPKDVFEAFYEGDCSEYIVKPISRKKLINLLKEYKLLTA